MTASTSSDESVSIPIGSSSDSGRQALATAVRRLMAATVSSVASSELLADATATLSAVADPLERYLPESDGVGASRYAADNAGGVGTGKLGDVMPCDVVIGPCNPVALPLVIEFDPPKAIGHATFTSPYEGAPGCVHGAVLAGGFDVVLTAGQRDSRS